VDRLHPPGSRGSAETAVAAIGQSIKPAPPTGNDADRHDPAKRDRQEHAIDRESLDRLFRDLGSGPGGLSSSEAARRLVVHGRNELNRRGGPSWTGELAKQLIHPLALLLIAAAILALVSSGPVLAGGILAVVVVNAVFAFVQEVHAERAVEALAAMLPTHARVLRDGNFGWIEATLLVTGDVIEIGEGDRVCADARLIVGSVDVDLSMLTGESVPVSRSAVPERAGGSRLDATDMVYSGTTVVGGQATAVVTATGMRTELGRISALSERVGRADSPLERQVRRVAWLIAGVAVVAGLGFLPIGVAAGMSWTAAGSFAIGLIVANVPEGLLPTITLALALGVREMASSKAVVKRLSAVETLGSTTVICTDKTGTLTQNRMRVVRLHCAGQDHDVEPGRLDVKGSDAPLELLVRSAAACTTAELAPVASERQEEPLVGSGEMTGAEAFGDPMEVAILQCAAEAGCGVAPAERAASRVHLYPFDPRRALMSTLDRGADGVLMVNVKGAPEAVLARCLAEWNGVREVPLDPTRRSGLEHNIQRLGLEGLRLLAVAQRAWNGPIPENRDRAESNLTLLGLVALIDPPRDGVAEAIRKAHDAGIRVHVVTGDNGVTASAIARRVGIGIEAGRVITGHQLDAMSDAELDTVLASGSEIVFARSSPEAKLRIADALRARGEVVAMTGDGVNDAPALQRSDIGIAMGRSGTDVAREAATLVLTDDHFATIVKAIAAGRRIYDNIRKFVVYIFAHAVPEVVPFLVFALSGGAVPLGLTVMQVLAIDLGTDLLPSLALSREPPEPGLMSRSPRPRTERLITGPMLLRAWGVLGVTSAGLVMTVFLVVLTRAGWHPGVSTGPGSALHVPYREATTAAWLTIVMCQLGAATAARTSRVALRSIGLFSNRRLLQAFLVSLAFAVAIVYVPGLHGVFGSESLPATDLLLIAPCPLIVWGVDELYRAVRRRHPPEPSPTSSATMRTPWS
jgi:magnesium-transporting ATPase (P-type)